jgi:beta-aspartyl-peptidase (threonine type)
VGIDVPGMPDRRSAPSRHRLKCRIIPRLAQEKPMIRPRRRIHLALCVASVCFAASFVGRPATAQETQSARDLGDTLQRIVAAQAEAWNRGDLEGFMEAYWPSEQLTFSSGGNVTRGWTATLDRYRQRYQNGIGMGKLDFSELEVTELGTDAAMMLGRWQLQVDTQTLAGNFTLVWRRIDGHWKIIHDHTSLSQPVDNEGG